MKSWNIRTRLALVCAMFILPLLLMLLIHGRHVVGDFGSVQRELVSVRALGAAWDARATVDDTDRRIRELAAGDLMLDDHPDAYPLANALSADLLDLALVPGMDEVEVARTATAAADDLSRAAAATTPGALRSRLIVRAADLRALAANPKQLSSARADAWWRATRADLSEQLTARHQVMTREVALQLALVAAFVAAALAIAYRIVTGLERRSGALAGAIDRLIRNDISGETPYLDDPHELGRLAKGVEALRRSLIETRAAWGDVLLNEMRYSLIAENMREVVLLTDLDGSILFASPSAEAICDDVDALEGAPVWDLFAAADARPLRDGAGGLVAGELARQHCRVSHDDGAWDVTMRRAIDDDESVLFVLTPPLAASQIN